MVTIENPKTLKYHTFSKKTSVLSIICSKCGNEDEKYLKKKNQKGYSKCLVLLKIQNYFKNMVKESISQEFRLKSIDETRNYFREEIEQSELMNKKDKKTHTTLNYIEQFLILVSSVTKCISISTFAPLLGIPIESVSSCNNCSN